MKYIMIVDDNHVSVDGICENINWEKLNAKVTHKVYDGLQAIQILENFPIDLIISDIEMPQLDGLSMTKEIFKINPSIKIILISAFDKFSYVQEAIRLGVYDYVEKPIQYDYLEKISNNALSQLDRERKNLEILKQSHPIMIENFFSDLLHYQPEEARYNLSTYPDYLGLNLNCHFFIVITIQLENATTLKAKIGIEKYHVMHMTLLDEIRERCQEFNLFQIVKELAKTVLIIGHNYSSKKQFSQHLIENFTDLLTYYENKPLQINIGLGSFQNNIWDLQTSSVNSLKALDYRFFFPQKNLFDIRDIPMNKQTLEILPEAGREELLLKLICKKDSEGIRRYINDLSETLLASYQTKHFIFIRIYSLLGRLLKFLYELDIDTSDLEKEIIQTYQQLDHFLTHNEIFDWLYSICQKVCQKLEHSVQSLHEQICTSVLSYAKEHYSDTGLCLNELAASVNVSPAHLSSVYKKVSGQNIIDLITNIRIETACQLLNNTTLSLKEISEKVGYMNQYYFSSCFKKKMKVAPSEYRNNQFSKH